MVKLNKFVRNDLNAETNFTTPELYEATSDQLSRRSELAMAREPLVHTLPRATARPSSSRGERGGGMLDAPPLRQAGRLQRVDEAPPPRDLHVMGIVVDDDIVVDMGRRTLLGCCACAACR